MTRWGSIGFGRLLRTLRPYPASCVTLRSCFSPSSRSWKALPINGWLLTPFWGWNRSMMIESWRDVGRCGIGRCGIGIFFFFFSSELIEWATWIEWGYLIVHTNLYGAVGQCIVTLSKKIYYVKVGCLVAQVCSIVTPFKKFRKGRSCPANVSSNDDAGGPASSITSSVSVSSQIPSLGEPPQTQPRIQFTRSENQEQNSKAVRLPYPTPILSS